MERYFIATEESELRKDYFDYLEKGRIMDEHVKKFFAKHGIESKQYIPGSERLCIIPTDADAKKFEKSLTKPVNGISAFKKNSAINKDWLNSLREAQLAIPYKPVVGVYFANIFGHFKTRLFKVNDTVYCSIDPEYEITETPKGFIEIKASEFYKVIEDATGKKV